MGKNNSRQSTGIQRSAVVSDANHQSTFKITPRNKIEILDCGGAVAFIFASL
jgi:hypothetical protein